MLLGGLSPGRLLLRLADEDRAAVRMEANLIFASPETVADKPSETLLTTTVKRTRVVVLLALTVSGVRSLTNFAISSPYA